MCYLFEIDGVFSKKNTGPKQTSWILGPQIQWKILDIQASDPLLRIWTLTTTLRTCQFGLGKNKLSNEILVANTLDFIFISYESKKIAHGVTTSAKRFEGRLSLSMPWLFLHVTRQRSVVGIDMKIDRFRLSKARQDGKMRLRLHKILDSFYIHGTIDQPIMLRLKAGRSCQGDQCPHLCGNHVHQQIHHS